MTNPMMTIVKGGATNFPKRENKFVKFSAILSKMESGDVFYVESNERANVSNTAVRLGVKISIRKQPDGNLAIICL